MAQKSCFAFLLFLSLLLPLSSSAQKEFENWTFGRGAGLRFQANGTISQFASAVNSREGVSTMSDPQTGELLFYTDGVGVWNKNHQLMPNGLGLFGNYTSTQSGVIVPIPGSKTRYYIFTTDLPNSITRGYRYSIVNMAANGGLGDVEAATKNTLLLAKNTEKITVARHCNNRDFWLVLKEFGNNKFWIYPITTAGIQAPLTFSLGTTLQGGWNPVGYLEFSSDQKMLAHAIGPEFMGGTSQVEMYRFDNKNGSLTGPFITLTGFGFAYGVEFSPDNKLLYVSELNATGPQGSYVAQYNLNLPTNTAILASKTVLYTTFRYNLGALQIAPNGKIYICKEDGFDVGADFLDVIEFPSIPGIACGYKPDALALTTGQTLIGLPNFPNYLLRPKPGIALTRNCSDGSFAFSITNAGSGATFSWNFDDPASGLNNSSTVLNPTHLFSKEGNYSVSVIVTDTCGGDTIKQAVKVENLPNVPDAALCKGSTVQLFSPNPKTLWNGTSTGNTYTVNAKGIVSYQIKDDYGCTFVGEVVVTEKSLETRSENISFCQGRSVTIDGKTYNQPGIVTETRTGKGDACDTIVSYTLSVLPLETRSENISFCQGRSVTIDGKTYNQPGIVTETRTGKGDACDTIVSYTLSVLPLETRSENISFCQGRSVTIDGKTYNQPGIVTETRMGKGDACDTIVSYTLSVLPLETRSENISFCQGRSVTIDGKTYNQPGIVTETRMGKGDACDTIVSYNLSVLPLETRSENISFCQGRSVTIDGKTYNQPGIVTETRMGKGDACDTIVSYTLSVLPLETRSENISFCQGRSVTIDGKTYNQPGIVTETRTGKGDACDTIVSYTLSVLPLETRSENISFCQGRSVTIDGKTYNQPGIVTETRTGKGDACDTIVSYTLSVLPLETRSENISFCQGRSVTIDGKTYNQPGIVTETRTGKGDACDTIVSYTLTILPTETRTENVIFCPGETVIIAGQNYTQPGTVTEIRTGKNGACDTLVTYLLKYATPAASKVMIKCPSTFSLAVEPGGLGIANYPLPTASTDCVCPGVNLTLTKGAAPGSAFPAGNTEVCYLAKDSCGNTNSCCFTVFVREAAACDIKDIGCMRYELLSITADSAQNYTYNIRVTNKCPEKLIYTAIQLPNGMVAMNPKELGIFTTDGGRKYEVRNPNYTPFYSIRFKSTTDSIANGKSDILRYTLPAQAVPKYIHISTRLSVQTFYEAHLNTFYCPIGVTPKGQRPGDRSVETEKEEGPILFPNPNTGEFFADLSPWAEQKVVLRVFNSQGQLLHSAHTVADGSPYLITLPESVANGLYTLALSNEKAGLKVLRFTVMR